MQVQELGVINRFAEFDGFGRRRGRSGIARGETDTSRTDA